MTPPFWMPQVAFLVLVQDLSASPFDEHSRIVQGRLVVAHRVLSDKLVPFREIRIGYLISLSRGEMLKRRGCRESLR